MTIKPDHWTATDLDSFKVCRGEPLARGAGWTFWEHPELGDEHPVLAHSMDWPGIIWDTHDYDVPERF